MSTYERLVQLQIPYQEVLWRQLAHPEENLAYFFVYLYGSVPSSLWRDLRPEFGSMKRADEPMLGIKARVVGS